MAQRFLQSVFSFGEQETRASGLWRLHRRRLHYSTFVEVVWQNKDRRSCVLSNNMAVTKKTVILSSFVLCASSSLHLTKLFSAPATSHASSWAKQRRLPKCPECVERLLQELDLCILKSRDIVQMRGHRWWLRGQHEGQTKQKALLIMSGFMAFWGVFVLCVWSSFVFGTICSCYHLGFNYSWNSSVCSRPNTRTPQVKTVVSMDLL